MTQGVLVRSTEAKSLSNQAICWLLCALDTKNRTEDKNRSKEDALGNRRGVDDGLRIQSNKVDVSVIPAVVQVFKIITSGLLSIRKLESVDVPGVSIFVHNEEVPSGQLESTKNSDLVVSNANHIRDIRSDVLQLSEVKIPLALVPISITDVSVVDNEVDLLALDQLNKVLDGY